MSKAIIIALAIIGALVLIALWLTFVYVREHVMRHGIHKIVGRTLMGRRTDGKRHTNASFWRKSDGLVRGHPVGRVGKRHHRAGIANLARTLGYIAALGLSGYGFLNSRTLTYAGLAVGVCAWLGWYGYTTVKRLRHWYTHRTYIGPLAEALGPTLELTGPETEELITMAPDYMTKKVGEIGRINVPPRFVANKPQLDAVEHLISTRLPIGAEIEPRLKGRSPYLLIKAAPSLPSMVPFKDYVSEIEALDRRQYIPGVTRTGNTYTASFAGEEPHHGMCFGSGRGKSTLLKLIIATTFHNEPPADPSDISSGATGTIIDPKDVSLDSMVGVPGLDFYNNSEDIPGMWSGIESVYKLMLHRKEQLKTDPTIEFPSHYLIMEEANSFAVMSSVYWRRNRPKGEPATPPIWADAIAPIFWRGRQFGIFVVLVAQSIQERFLGNLNLRPSLGLLAMSGYKNSQWATYVGTSPIPRAQKGRGRVIYVDGENETWVQCAYGTDSELRDFAMKGRTNLVIPDTETVAKVTGAGNAVSEHDTITLTASNVVPRSRTTQVTS